MAGSCGEFPRVNITGVKKIMKKLIYPILILVLILTISTGISLVNADTGDDWPMFHHDLALNGYSVSSASSTNITAWIYDTGSLLFSSPAVVDGTLYIGAIDGNLYAVNVNSGTLAWTYHARAPIFSSPAVSDGSVYFLSSDGVVHAVDALSGSVNWYVMIGLGPWDWASPAIHDGYVFVSSSNGNVYSLDASSGAINWSSTIGGQPDSPIAVVNGKVYTGTHNFNNSHPTLVALNEADGSINWTYDYYLYHNGVVGMVNSNGAAVVDGNDDGNLEVYFGVYNWNGIDDQAVCLDEATGKEIWTADISGNSTSTPAVHDGVVFIGSDNGKLYALDAATGTEKWSFQTGGMIWAAPAVADGKVFFGSHDHTFYALNEEDGSLIWSYFTGASRMLGSPAIANGMVIFGNENGKIYAFSPNTECPITVTKELVSYSDADGDGIIEVGEETSLVLEITVTNNDSNNPIKNVVVKDRLSGDLEVDDLGAFNVSGPSGKQQKNQTDKLFLTWEVGTLAPGESQTTTLIVSTDTNPGGHQEYTEAGIHYLNSGVNVKGSLLGKQVSATSDPIMIEVFESTNK